jgi:hypothetical protein
MLVLVIVAYSYFEFFGGGYVGTFLAIIFYLFSQLSIAMPVVIGTILFPNYLRSKNVIFYGTLGSWIFLTLSTLLGWMGEGIEGNLISTLIAMVTCTLFTFKINKENGTVVE